MMIDKFLRYLEYEKRYSAHTLTSYNTDLLQFKVFIKSAFDCENVREVKFPFLRSWIVELVEDNLSSRSINRKIASLRSFYKFLLRNGFISNDPTLKLKSPKIKKSLPVFVEEHQMLKLLDTVEFEDSFEGLRDKLIMELLYGTGIRLSELIELKVGGVDFAKGQIKVLGKGNKERIIPLNRSLIVLMQKYLELLPNKGNSSQHFVVNNKQLPSYPMFIYRVVKRYLTMITTVDKKSPHVLRHSFATHLLNKGAELNAIKELLGHTSLAATQVYTHNSFDKLKSVFDQAHPKA